ncbi:hypothetical protein MOB1_17820 [Faecalimonas mobilis]
MVEQLSDFIIAKLVEMTSIRNLLFTDFIEKLYNTQKLYKISEGLRKQLEQEIRNIYNKCNSIKERCVK